MAGAALYVIYNTTKPKLTHASSRKRPAFTDQLRTWTPIATTCSVSKDRWMHLSTTTCRNGTCPPPDHGFPLPTMFSEIDLSGQPSAITNPIDVRLEQIETALGDGCCGAERLGKMSTLVGA